MKAVKLISVSGGKDSTAIALLALEQNKKEDLQFIFADTGHEHEETYRYLAYLEHKRIKNLRKSKRYRCKN